MLDVVFVQSTGRGEWHITTQPNSIQRNFVVQNNMQMTVMIIIIILPCVFDGELSVEANEFHDGQSPPPTDKL